MGCGKLPLGIPKRATKKEEGCCGSWNKEVRTPEQGKTMRDTLKRRADGDKQEDAIYACQVQRWFS